MKSYGPNTEVTSCTEQSPLQRENSCIETCLSFKSMSNEEGNNFGAGICTPLVHLPIPRCRTCSYVLYFTLQPKWQQHCGNVRLRFIRFVFTIFSLVIIPVKKRKSSICRCSLGVDNLLLLALTSACLGSVAYDSERGVRQMQLWFAFCKDDRAED